MDGRRRLRLYIPLAEVRRTMRSAGDPLDCVPVDDRILPHGIDSRVWFGVEPGP